MHWVNVNEDLPENGTLCWAYIPNKGIILRCYAEDSFNLGEDDFAVTHWQKFTRPRIPDLTFLPQNPVSILRAVDHTSLCFSELSRNLAS